MTIRLAPQWGSRSLSKSTAPTEGQGDRSPSLTEPPTGALKHTRMMASPVSAKLGQPGTKPVTHSLWGGQDGPQPQPSSETVTWPLLWQAPRWLPPTRPPTSEQPVHGEPGGSASILWSRDPTLAGGALGVKSPKPQLGQCRGGLPDRDPAGGRQLCVRDARVWELQVGASEARLPSARVSPRPTGNQDPRHSSWKCEPPRAASIARGPQV